MTEQPDTENALLVGAARIRAYLKTLPNMAGVYRMMDDKGNVLYVGKAKNLKNRVATYAQGRGHSERITRMISETAEMLFVSTASESEALLLESNLIKRLRPRYNVIYRDDKTYPSILLRQDHDYPQVLKHRGARSTKGVYFGPFASAGAVNSTLNTLQRAFLLRTCSDSVFVSRTRPCLLFQIKRCSGPCAGRIGKEGYAELVREAELFLGGKSRQLQTMLSGEMSKASEALEFERAAQLRDRIRAMHQIQSYSSINPSSFEDADVFAAFSEGGETCIQIFFFRGGQNWGNRPFFPKHDKEMSAADVLESFVGQFYDDHPTPPLILLSHAPADMNLLAQAFSERAEHRIELAVPQRGEKREIMEMACQNAREQLLRRLAENSAQRALLDGVQELFELETRPNRIEVYDNSHIQGAHAVGGMIVAGPEGFRKNEYRRFNIKSTELTPGDDYAMMREVLTRRFARLVKEQLGGERAQTGGEAHSKWPDLVLIDGGPGQLAVAQSVLEDQGLEDVVLVGISKGPDRDAGREHFYMKGRAPFRLESKSPTLYYLQRLRDEAHRYAIGTHRAKRSKAISANPLQEIAGVGGARKRALLQQFGSARAISGASLKELESVQGISRALAKKIFDFFHPGG